MMKILIGIVIFIIASGLFSMRYVIKKRNDYIKRKEDDHRRFNERKGWRW